MMKKLAGIITVAVIALAILTGNALAAKAVQKTITIPADFTATIQTANCSALPGPRIDFQSQLMPAALQADIVFSNPKGQAPSDVFVADQLLIPGNSQVTPGPQSVTAAVASNPFIWLQLTNDKGQPLTSEIFLGQCSQGTFSPTVHFAVPIDVSAELSSSSCTSAPGPLVTISDGAAVLP